jgi:Heavy metal associated domain 2
MLNIRKNEGTVLDPAVVFRQDGAMLRASVVHHVPGRMRLRSPALKGDVFAIADLRSGFAEIAGITAVTANACTGSVLLEYDPAIVSPDELVEAPVIRGLTRPAAVAADGTDSRWADHLASAVKGWATNALAEQLAFSLIRLLV